mmetsp:Transcript_7393/g.9586  ORF Transcript_7393/g.9586 Transcript_7393/m.9586 type:complete len:94 (+) Transcript_7393:345-626(+)
MKNIPGKGGLSVLGCYSFFMRCNKNLEIYVAFNMEMDEALKGNTVDNLTLYNKIKEKMNEKKKAYAAMVETLNTAKSIATSMEKANHLAMQNT